MSAIKPVPDGYATVTPAVTIKDCGQALDFYAKALGAEDRGRVDSPDGRVLHAELQIGTSRVMFSDEFPEMGGENAIQTIGRSPVSFWLYVEDCDAAFRRAVEAGCTSMYEPSDMFWGDRSGTVTDPFGLRWTFATHVEEVSPEEMKARQEKMFGGGA